ncbi:MAG: TolC family protein [Akkermansiaceae bacterium]|nr:TolC family protein [Akkermansiaceae bacterium]
MFSHFTALCAASLLMVPALHAAPAVVVTPDTIPKRIRAQNPDLAAARLRIAEAVGRMKQAGRLDNPQLETSLQHSRDFREGGVEIGISQRFPVTDRLRREKGISVTELKAAELEVRQVEQKLVSDANRALIEVLAIRLRKDLLNRQSGLTKELAESIRTAAEKGEGSLLDAGQARVEAMQADTEARQLDAKEASALAELKPLLGIRPDEGLVVSGTLASPALPGTGADPSRRADFQLSKVEADIAEQSIGLEKAKRREDFEGGAFFSAERTEDAPEGYENEAVVGLRLKIPLPFWNKNEGNIEAAEVTHRRKQLETRALAESIRHEAGGARSEMAEWAKLIREIDSQLLPLATKQATDTEAAWRDGQADFQTVLKSRAQRLQLESTRLDALRDFHLARARHQAALGNF